MDRLSSLLERFPLRARVVYSGTLCGGFDFDETHDTGHLHLIRRGPVTVRNQDGGSIVVREPSLVFYPRPQRHRLGADARDGAVIVCASVGFGTGSATPLAGAMPAMLLVPLAALPALAHLLEALFTEAFAARCGRQAAMDRLAEVLLIQILRHTLEHDLVQSGMLAGLAEPRLARALTAMHEQPAREWQLADLARLAGMSRARFAAHFRETVGTTPGDYLAGWRVGLAQDWLKQGKPMKWIADVVGYGSPATLARAFEKKVGLTPKRWQLSRRQPQASEVRQASVPRL